MEDRLKKLRDERAAREQARLNKLRDLNLKKYPKSELQPSTSANHPLTEKRSASTSLLKTGAVPKNSQAIGNKIVKSSTHVNNTKRPITAPQSVAKKPDYTHVKPKVVTKFGSAKVEAKISNETVKNSHRIFVKPAPKVDAKKPKPNENKHKITVYNMSKPDISITDDNGEVKTVLDSAKDCNVEVLDEKQVVSKVDVHKPDLLITTKNDGDGDKDIGKKVLTDITKKKTINIKLFTSTNEVKSRKSLAAPTSNYGLNKPKTTRKSMLPRLVEETKSESVFERLYKPKYIAKKPTEQKSVEEKFHSDPHYIKKDIKNRSLMTQMHINMILGNKPSRNKFQQRRSISAVHLKRISKNEAGNCIHKWGSIGENLDKTDFKNEDHEIKEDKVVSAVKSERKKVQFMTPTLSHLNTPRPDELQSRLKSWLQKRGKSLSSYHHLQCFGLHHLDLKKTDLETPKSVKFEDALESPAVIDEENKENIALDSDSDHESINELMGKPKETVRSDNKIDTTNWRNVSMASESVAEFNDSYNHWNDSILTTDSLTYNELLYGALHDLSTLLREGFDWQQAARWLRSIRSRFPDVVKTAAYWECRAALEDSRGNLPASLECWKEAIAKGTEASVADSNLDQLLNKFMQLKISPQSGTIRQGDSKLVDVKNVFKSTIIRFAVQQAKMRSQTNPPTPCTVTPVRRSARLSHRVSRTPLRLCDTMQQAATMAPQHVFTHNDHIMPTP